MFILYITYVAQKYKVYCLKNVLVFTLHHVGSFFYGTISKYIISLINLFDNFLAFKDRYGCLIFDALYSNKNLEGIEFNTIVYFSLAQL